MAACAVLVALPGAARGDGGQPDQQQSDLPFVPSSLLAAAQANRRALFRVIVQGDPGSTTLAVADDVQSEQESDPGRARGTRRRYRSLIGVAAEITGRQLLRLARRPDLLAITPDAPLAPADLTVDPPPVDPPPVDPPPVDPPPVDPPPAPDPPSVDQPPAPAAVAPTLTTPPAISGTAVAGQTLGVDTGSWQGSGGLTFAFRWQRCDAAGESCVDVDGATGSTYDVVDADVGSTLRAVVTADDQGATADASTAPTGVVAAAPATPTVVTPPAVTGSAVWRGTLTVDPGIWQGDPAFAFRWQRCDATGEACADVPDATAQTYELTDADVGSTVRALVTATVQGAAPANAATPATPVVIAYSSAQLWPYSVGLDRLWPGTAPTAVDPSEPAIAVVDTGVDASAAGLGDRLVHSETLTNLPGNSPVDGRGHGTFVASVAAGASPGYTGAAPTARVVSLDVMDDNGMAMTSDVIAAADWIVAHKDEYGIRVANFSLVGTTATSLLYDPLDAAVERLWLAGVVVVTASGNYATEGADSGVLFSPGNDPFVLTVGASDINGTPAADDDSAAPWSAWGHTPDGFAKPELGAPGRYIVAGIPASSTIAQTVPERLVAPGFIQLSGTSFATAVASGVAAALIRRHTDWTPDQVKGALMASAQSTSAGAGQLGVGEIDAAGAAAVTDPPNPNAALDAFVAPDPATGTLVFDSAAWRDAALADPAWSAVSWGVVSWGVVSWGVVSWGVNYWADGAAPAAHGDEVEAATSLSDGAAGDFLPAGGYWISPPGG